MTAVRASGTGAGGLGSGADWINPEDVRRAGDLGLTARDGRMMGDENRITGLFDPVFFEFDQSFIRPEDRPVLNQIADHMMANPTLSLLIEGHCDWRGTTEYNLALGERRAQSAKTFLVNLGVPANRIETLSKGDLQAVTDGTEEQMAWDRRADFIFFR